MTSHAYQLVTAPTEFAITDAQMEAHARAAGQPPEQYQPYVRAAQAYVETITGRKLVTQTWKWFLDSWPFGDRFDLPFGQLQSVTHVKYTDTAGTQTTFSADYWEASTARDPGVLALSYNQSWPSTTLRVLDPIEIQFICGWTTAADAPYEIQAAILLVATHFYENRSAVGVGDSAVVTSKQVELGAMALLANWIIR
jgi:uncharacterized phiE125 gp8 family phage protein